MRYFVSSGVTSWPPNSTFSMSVPPPASQAPRVQFHEKNTVFMRLCILGCIQAYCMGSTPPISALM